MANTTQRQVINALDQFFAPDIQLKLDSRGRIIGAQAVSEIGAAILLRFNLLDRDYDSLRLSGVTFEVID